MSSARFDKDYCWMEVNLNRCSASFEVRLLNDKKILITFKTTSALGETSTQSSSHILIKKEYTKVLESFFKQAAIKVAEWNNDSS